jgi:hypothetical protein
MLVEQIPAAINEHTLDALVACFDPVLQMTRTKGPAHR